MTPEYINSYEPIYNYLICYFLPDLSDPYFRQDAAQAIEQDERMTYCRYMAAWLPHEPYYNEILNRIAGTAQCANDKEEAAEHPLYAICEIFIVLPIIQTMPGGTKVTQGIKF